MNKLIIFLYNLSFKKIMLVSLILSLIMAVPLVSFLINRETNLFSSASDHGDAVKIVDESLVPYPKEPPVIKHIEKFYGKSGDSIVLLGSNFAAAQKESTILLNNTVLNKNSIAYWSDTEVEVVLPSTQGLFNVSINVNGRSAQWWGKINVYNDLTTESVVINEKGGYIRVFDPKLKVIVYSLTGSVSVFGTNSVEQRKADVPVDLATSNIIDVEVLRNGLPIPFKVVSAK